MNISVAICTYNRADCMRDTLDSLRRLEPPAADWELLLIDNNCEDHTRDVAESFAEALPLRYIVETKQGLAHGRNRAIKECGADALVFTDDDIQVSSNWLNAYLEAFRTYPEASYFGGPISPWWPQGKPSWVRDVNMPLLGGLFGTYNLGSATHYYSDDEMHPFGANFALRRALFEEMDPFRVDLGVRGTVPGRGEEAEYFRRARSSGHRGVYVSDAQVVHRVEPAHMTIRFLYRFGIEKGKASRRLHGEHSKRQGVSQVTYFIKGLYQLVKGRGDRFRQCVVNMGISRGLRW